MSISKNSNKIARRSLKADHRYDQFDIQELSLTKRSRLVNNINNIQNIINLDFTTDDNKDYAKRKNNTSTEDSRLNLGSRKIIKKKKLLSILKEDQEPKDTKDEDITLLVYGLTCSSIISIIDSFREDNLTV